MLRPMNCQFGNVSGLFREFKKSSKKQRKDSKMLPELHMIILPTKEVCKAMQEMPHQHDFVDLPKFKNV